MKRIYLHAAAILSMVSLSVQSSAQSGKSYSPDKTIALPGDGGFDYIFSDQHDRKLYVSHGTTVQVVDLNTETLTGTIEGLEGVHGIAIVHKAGKGFITDGKANAVKVFDLKTLKVMKSIPLSGKKPDAILYDEFSNQMIAFNNGSNNASVIDVNTLTERKLIELGGAPEFGVSDEAGKIYNNLEDRNKTVVIAAATLKVVDSILLSPNGTPTALALDGKNKRLFSGCRDGSSMAVINTTDNKIIATVSICKAVDAIVYDPITKLIFCSGDGTTTVIQQEDADKYSVLQTIATKPRAKTMALDIKTHKIYISSADYEPGTKKIVPGTFSLLVYKMN